jgi:anaerobic ribonucleoside-triphosphate reductase activating protein
LATFIREQWGGKIKTAWYSGFNTLSRKECLQSFNFVKLGAYVESLGGLNKRTTNQRLYLIDNSDMIDITESIW